MNNLDYRDKTVTNLYKSGESYAWHIKKKDVDTRTIFTGSNITDTQVQEVLEDGEYIDECNTILGFLGGNYQILV